MKLDYKIRFLSAHFSCPGFSRVKRVKVASYNYIYNLNKKNNYEEGINKTKETASYIY